MSNETAKAYRDLAHSNSPVLDMGYLLTCCIVTTAVDIVHDYFGLVALRERHPYIH